MWLFYALATVALTTVLATLFRVSSVRTNDPRAFSFLLNTVVLTLTLIGVIIFGVGTIRLNPYLVALLILSCIGYGIFQRFQFSVRKNLESSVTQTLMTPGSVVAYMLAIYWLREPLTFTRTLGCALIVIATIMVVKQRRTKLQIDKWSLLAIAISVALNIAVVINRKVAPGFELALTYVLLLCFAQTLFTYLPKVSLSSVKKELRLQAWLIPILAVINVVSLYFSIAALKLAPASQVIPVLSSNVVFIALAGIVFLKEHSRVGIKIASAGLAMIGLILVSI